MLKTVLGASLVVLLGTSQDAARIDALVRQLEDTDWVEQAKAAKELAGIGTAAFDALGKAAQSQSSSKRYWSGMIVEEIYRRGKGGATPAAPVEPAPAPATAAEPAAMNFGQGENDIGSIMFICNQNAKHDDYEVVLTRCPTCGKTKRFTIDYKIPGRGFRCTVCGKQYSDYKCDLCGKTPGVRPPAKLKR
jgi:hypothetical protein